MRKLEELSNPNSCLNRAKDDEILFTLIARDVAFPSTVRFWVRERIRLGKNKPGDPQIVAALTDAEDVERELAEKGK